MRNARLVALLLMILPGLAFAQTAAGPSDAPTLLLDEVLRSVERHYPALLAAEQERALADAALQKARGGFDTGLEVGAISAPRGYYQNDRVGLTVEQPLAPWGVDLFGGYRLGRGDFAVYDRDLETNRDGEVRLGARVPLLRDRAIDDRRAGLRTAEIGIERADPVVREQRIVVRRQAELAYWEWLSAGEKFRIAASLLQLAEDRQESLRGAAEEGLIAEIVLVDNERLIAERQAIRIDAERRLQQAAIELSLYYRDGDGSPVIAEQDRLPRSFPALVAPAVELDVDVDRAREARPELQRLRWEREAKTVGVARARNRTLPGVDLSFQGSQDYGEAANDPDDKGDLEVKAGLVIELPLQRRRARGDLRAGLAEIARLDQQIRLVGDRIGAEVRDAYSAWAQAYLRFEQAARSVELARELEEAERIQVAEGNSDLLRLNIREQQSAQAAAFLVDVMTEYFEARAKYRAAIGELPPV